MATNDPWIENRRHVKGYPHGQSVRIPRAILKALKRVCLRCGEQEERRLAIDHVNGNSLDNRAENLQVLCRECHLAKSSPESPYRGFLQHDADRVRN